MAQLYLNDILSQDAEFLIEHSEFIKEQLEFNKKASEFSRLIDELKKYEFMRGRGFFNDLIIEKNKVKYENKK